MNDSLFFPDADYVLSEQILTETIESTDVQPMVLPSCIEERLKKIYPKKYILPRRQKFHMVVLLTEGGCHHHIGLHDYYLKAHDLVIIPENSINYTTDLYTSKGYCVQFKTEFLIPFIHAHYITDDFPFLDRDANEVVSLHTSESVQIQHHFQDLIDAYQADSPEKDNLVKSYLYILLLKIKELYHFHFGENRHAFSRAQIITKQYKLLVEKHFLSKKTVHAYAEMLCISAKHLADVLKQTLNKTPGDLIREMILLEAKVLLQQTDMTITQIAHHLHFEDQSYFSRFFKKYTNQTPQQYRTNH